MTTTHKLIPIMIIVICAAAAWMVLTNHSLTAHSTEAWSALRVLDRYQRGGGRDCERLEVAACIRQNGITGMTIRAWCSTPMSGNVGLMGVWGINQAGGIYVTGYQVDYVRWQQLCIRDGCVEANISLLQRVLK